MLGSPDKSAWPRGYPLDKINQQSSIKLEEAKNISFGVLQSLADLQPDVDAIFRLTNKNPFYFERPHWNQLKNGGK